MITLLKLFLDAGLQSWLAGADALAVARLRLTFPPPIERLAKHSHTHNNGMTRPTQSADETPASVHERVSKPAQPLVLGGGGWRWHAKLEASSFAVPSPSPGRHPPIAENRQTKPPPPPLTRMARTWDSTAPRCRSASRTTPLPAHRTRTCLGRISGEGRCAGTACRSSTWQSACG